MEIKQGDKVRVSKGAPKLYTDGWRFDWRNLDSVVGILDGDDATITPTDAGEEELSIPCKYLVKVDTETKEAKYRKGDRIKFKNIYELQKVKDKSFRWMLVMFASKEATITAVEDNGFYRVDIDPSIGGINDDMIECKVELTEHTEAEEEPCVDRINFAERIKRQREAHQAIVDEFRNKSFDWDAYAADLAKEVALQVVHSFGNPKEAAEYAVSVAKAVVDGLKRK